MQNTLTILAVISLSISASALAADMPDELRIKREQVFEFAAKPTIAVAGDKTTISFETKGLCDVSVAIEDGEGKIIRHLASGCLGPNAPEPFSKDSRRQAIVWDGKNDKGEYVKKTGLTARVSLGLRARYDKCLFWDPRKRISAGGAGDAWTEDVIPAAAPEGVYLYDGNGVDHIRLFDHQGNYLRTVYPFPADKLKDIKGLEWRDYPHGYSRPKKNGLNQTTFFTCGGVNSKSFALASAFSMAVQGDRIALAKLNLGRLKTDGSTGEIPLNGPKTWFNLFVNRPWDPNRTGRFETRCCPYSCAFSPDGKKVYLAGLCCHTSARAKFGKEWIGGVAVVDYDADPSAEAKVFVGDMQTNSGLMPGVACDAKGNVYISDFIHNCVNVYTPEAKLIKTLPVNKPTLVNVNPKTGEIYVFSWGLGGYIWGIHPDLKNAEGNRITPSMTVFKSMNDPKPVASYRLPPMVPAGSGGTWGDTKGGTQVRASVDFWTDPVTVWLVPEGGRSFDPYADGVPIEFRSAGWQNAGTLLLQPKDGNLEVVRDFGQESLAAVKRLAVMSGHQKLHVSPANGKLYVTEPDPGTTVGGGGFRTLTEINPETGSVRIIDLPLDSWAEDIAFDIDGNVYLRQIKPHRVIRYNPVTWREIPWDYGEEGMDGKREITSGLMLPAKGTVCASESGLWVSPRGHLAVCCSTGGKGTDELAALRRSYVVAGQGKAYEPTIYPGRPMTALTACVHIWDSHGKLIREDAVPGMSQVDGMAIDNDDNVYAMSTIPRVWNGKVHFNNITGTVFRAQPGKSKWLSDMTGCPVPLAKENRPKRSPDIAGYTMGQVWLEGIDWLYGGVGNCSFKIATGCICWQQSRFTIDYMNRSFAPETDQFSVAVLDPAGNLIMRIGKYGNVDDGMPLVKPGATASPKGPMLAPPNARSIGGDEVSLMQPSHVATFSDRYLYIGDVGNGRVVQVKLDYHAEEKVPLQ